LTVFDSTEISSGEALKPGQTGLVINESQLAKLSDWMKRELRVGDKLVVQGFSSGGMKLREIPIVGTYKQKGDTTTPEQMAFIDIDTLRVMAGMTVGANEDISLEDPRPPCRHRDLEPLRRRAVVRPRTGRIRRKGPPDPAVDTRARELANTRIPSWQFIVVRTVNEAAVAPSSHPSTKASRAWESPPGGRLAGRRGPLWQSWSHRIVFTGAIVSSPIVAVIIIMNSFVIA
jgi:hypothetical protein